MEHSRLLVAAAIEMLAASIYLVSSLVGLVWSTVGARSSGSGPAHESDAAQAVLIIRLRRS